MSQELIYELTQGKRIALISDCGTPVFADPGYDLVKACLRRNIDIVVVPGASSIMAGVVRSGFGIKQFLFAGFLSRMKEEREEQMKLLSYERRTVVLLETPYRLMPFLEAAKDILPYRNAYIGCNLTMPYETHHYGTFLDLYKKFKDMRFKGEFIVIFEGLPLDTKYDEGWKPYGSDRPEGEGNERPRRFDDRKGFSRGGKPFKRDDRGGSSRPYNNDRRSSGDRPYNKDRKEGENRPYNKDRKEGENRPYNKDRKEGENRPYNKDKKEGGNRPYNKDKKDGGGKPYNKDRKSSGDRPYNKDKKDGGGKPYNKDRKSGGDRPRSNDKKYEKKPFKKRDN
jgi:precorrin-6B methylase 1